MKLQDLRKRFRKGKAAASPAKERRSATAAGIPGKQTCPNCNGTGKRKVSAVPKAQRIVCARCDGEGLISIDEREERHPAVESEDHPGLAGGSRDGTTRSRLDFEKLARQRGRRSRTKYKLTRDSEGETDAILLFGRYAGSTVSALASDPDARGYLHWMLGQDFDAELMSAVTRQLEKYEPRF